MVEVEVTVEVVEVVEAAIAEVVDEKEKARRLSAMKSLLSSSDHAECATKRATLLGIALTYHRPQLY